MQLKTAQIFYVAPPMCKFPKTYQPMQYVNCKQLELMNIDRLPMRTRILPIFTSMTIVMLIVPTKTTNLQLNLLYCIVWFGGASCNNYTRSSFIHSFQDNLSTLLMFFLMPRYGCSCFIVVFNFTRIIINCSSPLSFLLVRLHFLLLFFLDKKCPVLDAVISCEKYFGIIISFETGLNGCCFDPICYCFVYVSLN